MSFRKTRIASYTGYVTHAVSVNLAPLLFATFQRLYGVSLGYLAVFTFVTFLVQIIMDISAASYMERVSYRALAVVSQLLTGMGLLMMGTLPLCMDSEAALMLSAVVYSSGGGLSEVMLSPLVEAMPKEKGRSSLGLLHSFYSLGHMAVILVTTVLLRLLPDEGWFAVPLLWSVMPLWCAREFCRVPMPPMTCHSEGNGVGSLLYSRSFLLLAVLMFCSGAGEQIMAQWSSFYAEVGLGVSKLVGDLLGPLIFALMMAVGRSLYGLMTQRIPICRMLVMCAAVSLFGYLAASLVRAPLVSLAACGLTGLGISLMWPGILSLSKGRYPGGGASMFALLAFGGDIGCSVGPFVCGLVSDAVDGRWSLRAGMLSGALFPLILIVGVIILKKKK